jgi:hypothetical protein
MVCLGKENIILRKKVLLARQVLHQNPRARRLSGTPPHLLLNILLFFFLGKWRERNFVKIADTIVVCTYLWYAMLLQVMSAVE